MLKHIFTILAFGIVINAISSPRVPSSYTFADIKLNITEGARRTVSKVEVLGRLVSCGFEIIDEKYIFSSVTGEGVEPILENLSVITSSRLISFSISDGLNPDNGGRELLHGPSAACIHGETAF